MSILLMCIVYTNIKYKNHTVIMSKSAASVQRHDIVYRIVIFIMKYNLQAYTPTLRKLLGIDWLRHSLM